MGPKGLKLYIFGNQCYSKNARKPGFYVFLYFIARKHLISSLYLKWTEFRRNCEFVPIYCRFPGTHNLNKIHNLLSVRSTSGKSIISYVFQHEN